MKLSEEQIKKIGFNFVHPMGRLSMLKCPICGQRVDNIEEDIYQIISETKVKDCVVATCKKCGHIELFDLALFTKF